MSQKIPLLVASALAGALASAPALAWEPTKPVEFVVTSGAGGGTDNFARMVQSIIVKHDLMPTPIVVVNKGGGSGAEGYVYTKLASGDTHKVTFGTNNAYLLPHVAKLAYKVDELTPIAAMAFDEFLLWVNGSSSYKDAKGLIEAAKAAPGKLKVAGSQSKDTDQTLTSLIETSTGADFTYIPYKGGSAAVVQLAGGHVDVNLNNPNENTGQWKAGMVRPLCVFSEERLAEGPKVTADKAWSDIPTCAEAGLGTPAFSMPRTVWLPGDVPAEVAAYYSEVLKKVSETPEWKEYITRTSQSGRFVSGEEFQALVKSDEAKNTKVFEKEGWLVQ